MVESTDCTSTNSDSATAGAESWLARLVGVRSTESVGIWPAAEWCRPTATGPESAGRRANPEDESGSTAAMDPPSCDLARADAPTDVRRVSQGSQSPATTPTRAAAAPNARARLRAGLA